MAKRNRHARARRKAMREGAYAGAGRQKPQIRARIAGNGASLAAVRPTKEQLERGEYLEPTGTGSHALPSVNQKPDMIGALYFNGLLAYTQEQAARTFQKLRGAYTASIGTRGYGSCLADNQSGYDSGDGDAEAEAAYRAMAKRLGKTVTNHLIDELGKGEEDRPLDIRFLRVCLGKVAG